MQRRAQNKDEHRDGDELGAMHGPDIIRFTTQKVDKTAHVVDQPDLDGSHHDRHESGPEEDMPEGLAIVAKKRPEASRRTILFGIVAIGINEVFEKTEHLGGLQQSKKGANVVWGDTLITRRGISSDEPKPVIHSRIPPNVPGKR